jgi:hypothetical protein
MAFTGTEQGYALQYSLSEYVLAHSINRFVRESTFDPILAGMSCSLAESMASEGQDLVEDFMAVAPWSRFGGSAIPTSVAAHRPELPGWRCPGLESNENRTIHSQRAASPYALALVYWHQVGESGEVARGKPMALEETRT